MPAKNHADAGGAFAFTGSASAATCFAFVGEPSDAKCFVFCRSALGPDASDVVEAGLPAIKSQRPTTPDEFSSQLPTLMGCITVHAVDMQPLNSSLAIMSNPTYSDYHE